MQPPVVRGPDALDEYIGRFLLRFAWVGASNLETVADSFADYAGLHEFPRNPHQYLPLFGVNLVPENLGRGVQAVWIRLPAGYIIQHSRYLTGKLGLVLWHEFFEIMASNPRFPTRLPIELEEKMATRFAVALMMPEREVRKQAADLKHPTLQNKTRVLAERFGVSYTAMKIRLREFGLEHKAERGRESYI